MNRRDFLVSALAGGAMYAGGTLPGLRSIARAADFPELAQRLLVNFTLDGGPDFRFLLPPKWNPDVLSYGYRYWQATASAHGIADSASAYEARWNDDYTPAGNGQFEFGIPAGCGWLRRMWDQGNVAIVCNVASSETRDHLHSMLILNQGVRTTGRNDVDRAGWGGRLAVAAQGNVMSLTPSPSTFCYGPHPSDPDGYDNSSLIAARNTREFALYDAPDGASGEEQLITASLRRYYAAKRMEMPADSIYRRIVEHEEKLRIFGEPVAERLDATPLPAPISQLFDSAAPTLASTRLGEQIRNLHDAYACSDIFDLRVLSLDHTGFDTHDNQREELTPCFEDLFGDGKAMDTLQQHVPDSAWRNSVFLFAGEFGRQIKANGDQGTDHGRGNIMLLVGEGVRGGVYGDMFPEEELARLDEPSPDIEGRTAIDHVFGSVCDWVHPGSGDTIFPGRSESELETGVDRQAFSCEWDCAGRPCAASLRDMPHIGYGHLVNNITACPVRGRYTFPAR